MQQIPEAQTTNAKRKKFIKLAEQRTNTAIKRIELIGNLGNHYVYEYNEEDTGKIIDALEAAVEKVKTRLNGSEKRSQESFKL